MVEELLNRLRLEGLVPERLTVIRVATESTVRDWRGEEPVSNRGGGEALEVGTGERVNWRSRFQKVPVEWGAAIVVGLWLVGSLTGLFPTRSAGEALGIALLLGLTTLLIGAGWRHFRATGERLMSGERGSRLVGSGGREQSRSNGRVIVALRLEGERRSALEKIVRATGGKPVETVNPMDLSMNGEER